MMHTVPLNVPVREQRPLIWVRVLPPLVPGGLGELAPRPVDGFYGGAPGDTIVVWGDADDGPVAPVQGDIVCFEVASAHAVEVPEFCEAGEEGAWGSAEGAGAEGCVERAQEGVKEDDNRDDDDEEHFCC